MAILHHGTTKQRAERIIARGPDPKFVEPHGCGGAENFSTSLEFGPYSLKTARQYAVGKAKNFPDEGGPVILVMDVPDEIIDKTDLGLSPLLIGRDSFRAWLWVGGVIGCLAHDPEAS
ncbi:MAG: hypothetical protein HYR84_16015 [Planctomycetes bacterium]|nr:hypothetical protein [Planctomycetota bacterium]